VVGVAGELGNARFVPPLPHRLEDCMAALERFIHNQHSSYPTLVKAAGAHSSMCAHQLSIVPWKFLKLVGKTYDTGFEL
jgi:hypothetical protein